MSSDRVRARLLLWVAATSLLIACGRDEERANATIAGAEKQGVVDHAMAPTPDSAIASLSSAVGPAGGVYRPVSDTAALRGGILVGRVKGKGGGASGDSAVVPTHDHAVCQPFTETTIPSANDAIGNAVVWLVGATTGPAIDAPRRITLTLDRCQLSPRVQRMSIGGTVMVSSRDAMMSRLRFVDADNLAVLRAQITFNDAGQMVPSPDVAAQAGLVEVRDDLHPWVRAYIAVAPHPFVAVTTADGLFRFDGVPPGVYSLVVWQEKLGVRTQTVRITARVETRVEVALESR